MYKFGVSSQRERATLHPDAQMIVDEGIKIFDFTILCGARDKEWQNKAFAEKKSQLKWPQSKHNCLIVVPEADRHLYKLPFYSMAFDFAPYPIDWKKLERFAWGAGILIGIGNQLFKQGKISHLPVSGFDWNRDGELKDTKFVDAGHIELWFPPTGFVLP